MYKNVRPNLALVPVFVRIEVECGKGLLALRKTEERKEGKRMGAFNMPLLGWMGCSGGDENFIKIEMSITPRVQLCVDKAQFYPLKCVLVFYTYCIFGDILIHICTYFTIDL